MVVKLSSNVKDLMAPAGDLPAGPGSKLGEITFQHHLPLSLVVRELAESEFSRSKTQLLNRPEALSGSTVDPRTGIHRTDGFVLASSPASSTLDGAKANLSSTPTLQQQTKKVDEADLMRRSQELYKAMKGGLFGCGTDEEKLMAALEGLSPEDVIKLKELYKEHYGEDLETHLNEELSGTDLERAKSLLAGDTTAGVADALYQAMDGAGTDEAAIRRILAEYKGDPAELERVYKERHKTSLRDDLKSELSDSEFNEAAAYLNGDKIEAACSRLNGAIDGLGTDEEAVKETLKGLTKDELKEVAKRYKDKFGESLEDALAGDFSGLDLEEVQALRVGNTTEAAAIRLKKGIDSKSREQLESEFVGKSQEERQAILEAYDKRFGSGQGDKQRFLKDAKSILTKTDYDKVEDACIHGEVSLAQRIHSSVDGMGTGSDIDALIKELGNLPEDQAKKVQEEYQRRYGESLKDALQGDLSGRSEDDAMLYLNGLPKDPIAREIALAKRTLQQIKNDREGFSIGNMILDPFTDKDERVDETAKRLESFIDELERKGSVSAEELEQLKKINSWANSDLQDVREAKDAAADTAATVGATVAAGAVIIGTAGTATPLVVAGYAAVAGAVGYAGSKALIKGGSYELDGLAVDLAAGGVDGAMNVVGAGVALKATSLIGKGAFSRVSKFALESAVDAGLGGAAGGAVQSGLQKETWKDGVLSGLSKVAQASAEQGVIGAATGIALKTGLSGAGVAVGLVKHSIPGSAPHIAPQDLPSINSGLPPINSLADDSRRLASLRPGERMIVGRRGDIQIDDNYVGREHLSIIRTENGGFRLLDGDPASANGVFVNGRRIPQQTLVPISPGEQLVLGQTPLTVPPRINPRTGQENTLYSRLRAGERIVIGRSPTADVHLTDPGVSQKHAFLTMDSNGQVHISDGRASEWGSEVRLNGKWQPIAGAIEVPPGTLVRIAGRHEFRLPSTGSPHKFSGNENGIQWRSSIDPRNPNPQTYAVGPQYKLKFTDTPGIMLVRGAGEKELKHLHAALDQLSPESRRIFAEIEIVDHIGEIVDLAGNTSAIRAMPLAHQKKIVIARSSLKDEKSIRELFDDVSDAVQDSKPGKFQERNYTQLGVRHLQARGHFSADQAHGQFGDRHLIGHDASVNGGVRLRGSPLRGWGGEPKYMGIVVDDSTYSEMIQHFERFRAKLMQELDPNLKGAAREAEIVKHVHMHVYKTMKYTHSADLQVLDKVGLLDRPWEDLWDFANKKVKTPLEVLGPSYNPAIHKLTNISSNSVPKIHLFDYIDQGIGVCEHQSLFASYLLEKLQAQGVLPPTFKFCPETNMAHVPGTPQELGGHAWTRITLSDGNIWITDPAQNYVGPLGGPHSWLYQRPDDWIQLLNRPI